MLAYHLLDFLLLLGRKGLEVPGGCLDWHRLAYHIVIDLGELLLKEGVILETGNLLAFARTGEGILDE